MINSNQAIVIDKKIPLPWEVFGAWFYKPIGVIENYYFYFEGDRPDVNSLYELLDLPESKKVCVEELVLDCEWPDFHFHLGAINERVLPYLSNYDELSMDWMERFMEDYDPQDDFDPEEIYTPNSMDVYGAYYPNSNSVLIDIYKIENHVSQEDSIFTFEELFKLVLFHEYGHWIAYNLNITCTSNDGVKVGDSHFQELFAQLFTCHLLHKDNDVELRSKMDKFSESQPSIYREYLNKEFIDVIKNSDLLAFVLFAGRNNFSYKIGQDLINSIKFNLDLINNGPISYINEHLPDHLEKIEYGVGENVLFPSIQAWKDALREITNEEWVYKNYFKKDVVNNDMLLNTDCYCGKEDSTLKLDNTFIA